MNIIIGISQPGLGVADLVAVLAIHLEDGAEAQMREVLRSGAHFLGAQQRARRNVDKLVIDALLERGELGGDAVGGFVGYWETLEYKACETEVVPGEGFFYVFDEGAGWG